MINNGNTQNFQLKFIFHLGMPSYQSLDCKYFYLGNAFLPLYLTGSGLIFKKNYLLQEDYNDTKLVKTNKYTNPVPLANIFPNYLPWLSQKLLQDWKFKNKQQDTFIY